MKKIVIILLLLTISSLNALTTDEINAFKKVATNPTAFEELLDETTFVTDEVNQLLFALVEMSDDITKPLQMLLDEGANLNYVDSDKRTPLMHAARLGNARVVAWLLSKGANKSLRDANGKTAYDLAKKSDIKTLLTQEEESEEELGGNKDARLIGDLIIQIERRQSAFSEKYRYTLEDIQKLLDENPTLNLNYKPDTGIGDTALIAVVRTPHNKVRRIAITKLLLEHGADVNVSNNINETPLVAAAGRNDNTEVLQLLLERGANPKDIPHALENAGEPNSANFKFLSTYKKPTQPVISFDETLVDGLRNLRKQLQDLEVTLKKM